MITDSLQYVKKIGTKRAEAFNKIGIKTINDLLFYFPNKHINRSNLIDSNLATKYSINGYDGEVTLIGRVVNKELVRYGNKQIFKVNMHDESGYFDLVWFQGVKFFKDRFKEGEIYAISGKPVLSRYGNLQFTHPDFDKLADEESQQFKNTGKIIPIYSLPQELKAGSIGEYSLREIIQNAVAEFLENITETLPEKLLIQNKLFPLQKAVKEMHQPESIESLAEAKRRMKFEELFYIEILVAKRYNGLKNKIHGRSLKVKTKLIHKFLEKLPFKLTESQLKVLHEIRLDMEAARPMNRLIQGDVGSGKTIVALISMLIAVDSGFQSALMVPTEILASQHLKNLTKMLQDFGIDIQLLIGGQKSKERAEVLQKIADGTAQIVIGTHAIIEENVEFKNLGLVVIDEQHRFGVGQRGKLIVKGSSPDVLILTATPIPRTLTMTVYGDLDISIINEMPANRKEINTNLRGENKLLDIYKFILEKIKDGYQSYIVYPLVEESEKLDLKAALEHYEMLKNSYLKEARVALIHGKMNWREKEEVMTKFAAKDFDVLISTTVIEVGIDVPDANIIVINDAFRFGLSQLHQLRGRVGRSDKQAYCILVAKDEFVVRQKSFNFNFEYLSKAQIEKFKSIIRLNAMTKISSGFELAEIDLKLRGPGNIFGTEQSGLPNLKFADITTDTEILAKAKHDAFNIIISDPELQLSENDLIKITLNNNYRDKLVYSEIG